MKLFICPKCNNEMNFNEKEGIISCPDCNNELNVTDFEHPALGSCLNSEYIHDYSTNNINHKKDATEPDKFSNRNHNEAYFIPFTTTENDITTLFNKKLTYFFLKPSFKKMLKQKKFSKLFVPIWTHNIIADGKLDAICTEFDNNATNYFFNEKEMKLYISNLNTAANSKYSSINLSPLFPYDFARADVLTDENSDDTAEFIKSDINSSIYTNSISDFTDRLTKKKLDSRVKGFASIYNKEYITDSDIVSSNIIYLPLWLLNSDNNRIYINGQTGKISGEFPLSKMKLGCSFLIIFMILFTIINLLLLNI